MRMGLSDGMNRKVCVRQRARAGIIQRGECAVGACIVAWIGQVTFVGV